MESSDLQKFCEQKLPLLVGATIRRIRCARSGLILECQEDAGPFEWSFVGCRNVVLSMVLRPGDRERRIEEAAATASPLAAPIPAGFFDARTEATLLDAMRLWLLQPSPRPPEWKLLEGCTIRSVTQPESDRILQVALQSQTQMGEKRSLQLQVELFSRGLNLILTDPEDGEIANWQGRAAATPRPSSRPEQAGSDEQNDGRALGFWQDLASACAVDVLQETRRVARRERRRLQQLVRGLERDFAAADSAAEWRKKGELLSANLHRVRKGQAKVALEDWTADNAKIELELDPSVSPQENVARFFKRAKRGERGYDTIAARLGAAQKELQAIPAPEEEDANPDLLESLMEGKRSWKQALEKDSDAGTLSKLWQPGGPQWQQDVTLPPPTRKQSQKKQQETPSHPGRRFLLAGKWEVLVGRSNAENDELTHRFAHPQDVWLHAGGVPGSHVVLRMQGSTDNPPRDILEQAAAIAARFSKAKHAGTVPVIWTRKRHVRKPRGSKAGLAMCTQEKTVFVKPGIPEE